MCKLGIKAGKTNWCANIVNTIYKLTQAYLSTCFKCKQQTYIHNMLAPH